jgi:hypothetical protein
MIIQRDGMHTDRNAAFAFEVHCVELLLAQITQRDRSRNFEQAIGERCLAVVDVRNNAEVSDVRRDVDTVRVGFCQRHAIQPSKRRTSVGHRP